MKLIPHLNVAAFTVTLGLLSIFNVSAGTSPARAVEDGGANESGIAWNAVQQQAKKITGQVLDENGEPVIGANVIERGTTNGTVTDFDGNFTLEVQESAILQISYIGYLEQTTPVAGNQVFRITLKEDSQNLEEVVVVGYGIQKKSVVTAAISKVTSKELQAATPTRIEDVLKGKVSGVQITQNSGQPGAASVVRVRGIGTINNSDPLYIVDGMPVSSGIDYLNPRDIESVEVLKDAASAAIYGARAANGVILVSTKSGSAGKTNISYQFSYGIQNPWHKRQLLNGSEYEMIMNEARANAGQEPLFPQASGKNVDWQELIFNSNAPIVNHTASISGGTDKGSYYRSFGLIDQEGIVAKGKSDYTRYNFRLNSDYLLFQTNDRAFLKKGKIGINAGYTQTGQHGIIENDEFDGPLFAATMAYPNTTVYTEDAAVEKELSDRYGDMIVRDPANGRMYEIVSGSELANPLALIQVTNQRRATQKLVASIWGEFDLIDDVIFKTSYSTDLTFGESTNWSPAYYLSETRLDNLSRIQANMNRRTVWNFENTLRYSKSIDRHNFSALLGTTVQKNDYVNIQGKNVNLIANMPEKDYLDFALGTKADQETSGGATEHALASFFGRFNYNLDERYLAELILRRDGSSNFPTDSKWAYFPSASLGWNIHNEAFFSKEGPVNQLKLRASWGKNGNEAIGAFQYTSLIRPGANYIFGDATASGMSATRLVNRQVRWEESEQYDAGVDIRLFNSSLSATVDVFHKTTNGMLMSLPIPDFIGNNVPDGNVGSMTNQGVEMELSYTGNASGLGYQIGVNASYMENKIKDIGVPAGYIDYQTFGTVGVIQRHTTGLPVAHFFGTPALGVFQNMEEVNNYKNSRGELLQPNAVAGDVIFRDTNGDGVINDDDRTFLGKPTPDWTLGFNAALNYRGFDLTMFWQGAFGNEIFDGSRRLDLALVNYSSYILERWHGEGTSGYYPRVVYANQDKNNNTRVSSLYIYSGDYLRLKNLQLGYTFPASLTRKCFVRSLRLYAQAENLLTFTKYHGGDPEIGTGRNSAAQSPNMGVDRGVYPQSRTISFGASISF
jgi:TonB-linked SusC/RagA family outer membrane protein